MIWVAVALVAALGIWGPDCHQSATVVGEGETAIPLLEAVCKF
jgi:hypothetical protein